jgi:FkbM family methyltransferase
MLAAASEAGRETDLRLHAFEPDSGAFTRLAEVLDGRPATVSKTALSDRQGTSPFYVVEPAAGTNSLYAVPEANPVAQETVVTTTLDSYAEQSGVARFALVKIDAEGHDLAVLRGARTLLAEHRIAVAQFEYNHRWILGRFYLRDAFEFLLALGYRVGKVTPRGVEFYPRWDMDLETFVEGNYLACDPAAAAELPAVTWWKSRLTGCQVLATHNHKRATTIPTKSKVGEPTTLTLSKTVSRKGLEPIIKGCDAAARAMARATTIQSSLVAGMMARSGNIIASYQAVC